MGNTPRWQPGRHAVAYDIADAGAEIPAKIEANFEGKLMLYTIATVLIILWLLGMISSYAIGGFIHILLVIALIMILVDFISGRRRA